jgi:SAM-dependent methyltransferase
MTPAQTFDQEQLERWNGNDGDYWATYYQRLDRTLAPVTGPLIEFAAPQPGSTALDIGCGCGATTLELARAVGPTGRVVGADISAPMLAVAKQRLHDFPNAGFRHGSAGSIELGDIAASLVLSRFGVMFFGDPVAAFANIRTAVEPGGRLCFACWRPINENPWLQIPLHAVYEHVPRMPKPNPEEPGPFSFGDPERVTRILTSAGFAAPSFTRLDIKMELAPEGGGLDEAATQSSSMGPAKRALAGQPDEVVAAAVESIRAALAPHVSAEGVKLPGAVWLVAASLPA